MSSFIVASFNVNSIRSRLELMEAWLRQRGGDIDVLAMQEIKATEDQFPFDFFERLGYTCRINPQKRYNGVAICSKHTPDEVSIRFGSNILDGESRLIYARFGAMHLINLYAPHGEPEGPKYAYKRQWYDALTAWLKGNFDLRRDRVVLTGDFNITFDDRDVYDPVLLAGTVGTLSGEREKLYRLIELGFIDAFRLLHPGQIQYTWWDYRGAKIWKNQGMRIDHMLISPPVKPYLQEVEVDMWPRRKNKIKPSDHAPLLGYFKPEILES